MAGSRLGFFRHFAVWLGVFLGGVLATALMPSIADRFANGSDTTAFAAPFATVFICSFLGAFLLGALTRALRSSNNAARTRFIPFDRTLGALAGVATIAFVTWSLTPVVTATRYWPVEISKESGILKMLEEHGPRIPSAISEAAETFRQAKDNELATPNGPPNAEQGTAQGVNPPKAPTLSQSVVDDVSAATLRVEGRACTLIQDGTGVVIAKNLVVTNAHVIAGESATTSVSNGEFRRRADVVAFDPRRDIAVLRIQNLNIKPLHISTPITKSTVAIFGYPGGRELRVEGGRIVDQIKATGADLYGKGNWSRKVLILAADLVPGDSGGPVISQSGQFVGLSFAVDPQLPHTSYALDPSEIREVLKTVSPGTVSTGKCLKN